MSTFFIWYNELGEVFMIKEIFYELILEAKDGKVIIDSEEWPIGFNTRIEEDNINYDNERNLSELVIEDKDNFFKVLEEYIYLDLCYERKVPTFLNDIERNKIKWIMAYLFVNATTEEFIRPVEYIKRRIAFLKDSTFSYLDEGIELDINNLFMGSKLEIKNNVHSEAMETPYRIDINLVNELNGKRVEYSLPTISYGICEEDGKRVCYIYSIMKSKKKKEHTTEDDIYDKKIARMLYKLNAGVENYEMSEYYEYKEGDSKYYPEGNITDITPSFLLSLSIFITLLQKEGISKVKGVSYLPVRYLSRDITASNAENEDMRYQLKLRNDMIQNNITNKFIRTFRRLAFHDRDIRITSYPYEESEYIEMDVMKKEHMISNPILEEISYDIYNMDVYLKKMDKER